MFILCIMNLSVLTENCRFAAIDINQVRQLIKTSQRESKMFYQRFNTYFFVF